MRTRLGRIIRDVQRKIVDRAELRPYLPATVVRLTNPLPATAPAGLEAVFVPCPEVECIGKGKASAPYEFGVKASIVSTNARAPGGQFVLHAKALPWNPYDGHTLRSVIEGTEKLIGCEVECACVDKGYRGHERRTRAASSSPARSAACTAPSSESCDADPPSKPLSVT